MTCQARALFFVSVNASCSLWRFVVGCQGLSSGVCISLVFPVILRDRAQQKSFLRAKMAPCVKPLLCKRGDESSEP